MNNEKEKWQVDIMNACYQKNIGLLKNLLLKDNFGINILQNNYLKTIICENDLLNCFKILNKHYENQCLILLNDYLSESCKYGATELTKYLLSSNELLKNPKIDFLYETNQLPYRHNNIAYVCQSGNVELLEYAYKIHPNIKNADINNLGYILACSEGHIPIIRYLISQEQYKNKDLCNLNSKGLCFAMEENRQEMVLFLLYSNEIKDHADIHINNDEIFRGSLMLEQYDKIDFLIEKCHLRINKNIVQELNVNNRITDRKKEKYQEIIKKFDFFDLYHKLDPKQETKEKTKMKV